MIPFREAIVFLVFSGGTAMAACSAKFDGYWAWEATANNQCTIITFGHDNTANLVGATTWTNLGSDCAYAGTDRILEADYDNRAYKNLNTKSVSSSICELTFKKAHVPVDRYGAWKPVSRRARLTIISDREIEWCWENSGHQFGNCSLLEYVKPLQL